MITQRSALRLGPELANEKVRKIKKSAHTLKKKNGLRESYGAGEKGNVLLARAGEQE